MNATQARRQGGFMERLLRKRDFYAGGLMIVLGLFIALKGMVYGLGTLMNVGSGFLPTAIGSALVGIGILIALNALSPSDGEGETILPEKREWLAWACILASPVLFILFGTYFGFAPATFSCVFVAAIGDREATLKIALALATAITIVGILLFWYLLQIPMPLVTWGRI